MSRKSLKLTHLILMLGFIGIFGAVSLGLMSLSFLKDDQLIIYKVSGKYLPLMDKVCEVSYLIAKQNAKVYFLDKNNMEGFQNLSLKIKKLFLEIEKILKEIELKNYKEKEIINQLFADLELFKKAYDDYYQSVLKSFKDKELDEALNRNIAEVNFQARSFIEKIRKLNTLTRKESISKVKSMNRKLKVAFFIIFSLIFFVSLVTIKIFQKGIKEHQDKLKDLLEGEADLSKRIPVTGDNELNQTAKLTNNFLDRIHQVIREITDIASRLSSATEILAKNFEKSVKNAEKGRDQSQKIYHLTEEIEEEMVTMTSSMEEMRVTINEISKNTQETSLKAEEVQRASESLDSLVKALINASQEIQEMSSLIGNIADQTNLLALNATIEAARAGEAGKGFAVVAGEVKELARQSSTLVEKIGKAISNLFDKVEEVSRASDRNRQAAETIAEMAHGVAAAVEEQSTVVDDLGNKLMHITGKMKHLREKASEMMTENAQLLEEARRLNTKELVSIGKRLRGLLQSFRI